MLEHAVWERVWGIWPVPNRNLSTMGHSIKLLPRVYYVIACTYPCIIISNPAMCRDPPIVLSRIPSGDDMRALTLRTRTRHFPGKSELHMHRAQISCPPCLSKP